MNNKYLVVTTFLLLLSLGGGIFIISRDNQTQPATPSPASGLANTTGQTSTPSATVLAISSQTASVSGEEVVMENGLKIEDELVGTGAEAVSGKMVTVNYTGTLTDGTKFDSSYDHGTPFSFNLGAGEVIAGWDQGFNGMKVGGKRKLTIPPSLGYGAQAIGAIPPNSTLIFEVELLKVE